MLFFSKALHSLWGDFLEMGCIPRYHVWGWRNMWRKQIRSTKPFKKFCSVNILPKFQIAARTNLVCWPGSCGQAQSHSRLPSGGNQGYWTPSFHLSCNSFHFLKAGEQHLPSAPNKPAWRVTARADCEQCKATVQNTCFVLPHLSDTAHANRIVILSEWGYDQ